MNTSESKLKKKVARALRTSTKRGLWRNPEVEDRGVPVAFDGDQPTAWITAEEVERRVSAVKDLARRRRMEVRLGLGEFRPWAPSDRQAEINRLYDRDLERGRQGKSPRPARTATDALSEEIAAVLLAGARSAPAPAYDSTRLLYSRSITFPPGNVGELIEIHRRVIRAEIDGLDRILIHQTEHWDSAVTATAQGMGGVSVRPVRVHEDTVNGIVGERLDVEITFPAMKAHTTRELLWTRRRTLEPGWLKPTDSMVFSSTPDHPTEEMVIEIEFGEGALPWKVGRFEDVYYGDRRASDIPFTMVPLVGRAVRYAWRNPQVGRTTGLRAWWVAAEDQSNAGGRDALPLDPPTRTEGAEQPGSERDRRVGRQAETGWRRSA